MYDIACGDRVVSLGGDSHCGFNSFCSYLALDRSGERVLVAFADAVGVCSLADMQLEWRAGEEKLCTKDLRLEAAKNLSRASAAVIKQHQK